MGGDRKIRIFFYREHINKKRWQLKINKILADLFLEKIISSLASRRAYEAPTQMSSYLCQTESSTLRLREKNLSNFYSGESPLRSLKVFYFFTNFEKCNIFAGSALKKKTRPLNVFFSLLSFGEVFFWSDRTVLFFWGPFLARFLALLFQSS